MIFFSLIHQYLYDLRSPERRKMDFHGIKRQSWHSIFIVTAYKQCVPAPFPVALICLSVPAINPRIPARKSRRRPDILRRSARTHKPTNVPLKLGLQF